MFSRSVVVSRSSAFLSTALLRCVAGGSALPTGAPMQSWSSTSSSNIGAKPETPFSKDVHQPSPQGGLKPAVPLTTQASFAAGEENNYSTKPLGVTSESWRSTAGAVATNSGNNDAFSASTLKEKMNLKESKKQAKIAGQDKLWDEEKILRENNSQHQLQGTAKKHSFNGSKGIKSSFASTTNASSSLSAGSSGKAKKKGGSKKGGKKAGGLKKKAHGLKPQKLSFAGNKGKLSAKKTAGGAAKKNAKKAKK